MKKGLFLLLAFVICLGCKSRGDVKQAGPEAGTNPEVPAATAQAEPDQSGFSWKKAMQLVGFQQSTEEEAASAPQRMGELKDFAQTVAVKADALNPADSPEVTRSKAQELLEALRPWESVLAAGRSVGVLNDVTAQHLDSFVKQLRIETSKLIQFTPNLQTIGVVKNLGSGFRSIVDKSVAVVGRGSSLLQAFRGTSRS